MRNRRSFIVSATSALAAPFVVTRPAAANAVRLVIAHNNAPQSAADITALAMQKHILSYTQDFVVDVYPYSMLGNEMQMAQAMVDGSLACNIVPTGPLSKHVEEVSLLEYPFLLPDLNSARKSLDGKLGAYLGSMFDSKGMKILSWAENGIRHITAKRPIRTPADLKGLKLRVQPIKIHQEVFKALGAAAAPMAWTDLPSAMRSGLFEAQENPINNIAANEFIMQLQTHLSLTSHVYSPSVVVFSNDAWARLSPRHRDIVADAAAAGTAACRRLNDEGEAESRKKIQAAGLQIVSDVDTAAFQRAIETLGSDVTRHFNGEVLNQMRKLVV